MRYQTFLKDQLQKVVIVVSFVLLSICIVGVEAEAATTKLKVTPGSKTIYVGDKVTLKSNKKVKWSVVDKKTNAKIVSKTSKKAVIKGVKAGTVYVMAKAGKKTKKIKIIVRSKAPTKINIACSSDTIGVGGHCSISVKSVEPSYASADVNFTSSDEEIATVSDTGYVTGVSAGTVAISVTSKYDSKSSTSVTIRVVNRLKGDVTMSVDFSDTAKYPKGKVTEVWIPIPQTEKNQIQVVPTSVVKWKAQTATKAELTVDSAGNNALYIMWDENAEPMDRKATVSYYYSRIEIVCPDDLEGKEAGDVDTDAMLEYLKETKHSGSLTGGVVKETADQIVQDASAVSVYQKAYAIYDWVCENLMRNKSLTELGTNDVSYVLNHKDERICGCADINETFVALCRAEGIPSRVIYGLKMDSIQNGLNSSAVQKSIAQFYLPGYGWVDADACSVLQIVAGNEANYRGENAKFSSNWKNLKKKYWGAVSENWMKLSTGEDIELSPRQSATSAESSMLNEDGSLYYFVYPYAQYDGKYIRAYDGTDGEKTELNYTYSFVQELDNCGCD